MGQEAGVGQEAGGWGRKQGWGKKQEGGAGSGRVGQEGIGLGGAQTDSQH